MGQFKPVSEPFSELANPRFFTTYLNLQKKNNNEFNFNLFLDQKNSAMLVLMYVLHIAILIVNNASYLCIVEQKKLQTLA